MSDLKSFIETSSTFLHIADGEEVHCQYLGYKVVTSRFDPDVETVRYTFVVNGNEKTFESRSVTLAEAFDALAEGCFIILSRKGEGNKTKYEAKEIIGPDEPNAGEEKPKTSKATVKED